MRRIWRAVKSLLAHNGVEIAGFIAYTGLVSFFPFIIFIFALAGFFREGQLAETLINRGFTLLPLEVADTLRPIVQDIMKEQRPGLLTFSIAGALWVASSGIEALRLGINLAYGVKETRPIWKLRLHGFGLVIASSLIGLLAAALIIAVPLALKYAKAYVPLPEHLLNSLNIGSYALSFMLLTLFTSTLYIILPNIRHGVRQTLPGALLAAFGWVALASLFSAYLLYFNHYSVTYGSLGGVVITLLFLHFSTIMIIFGAEYNACEK